MVHLIRINAVLALAEVAVVVVAYVEHAQVVAVEEHMAGLPVLAVHIEARANDNLLDGGVDDAGVGVVAAVAHLQGLILIVFLLAAVEGIVEGIESLIHLACLQAEGGLHGPPVAATVGTRPPAGNLEVGLLVKGHLVSAVLGHQILHVDGPLPVHVPVAGGALALSAHAVGALGVHAYLVVIQMVGVGGDGEHGQVVFARLPDVGAGDHGAGQGILAHQHKAVDGGGGHGEPSRDGGEAVAGRGGGAVLGVAQRGTGGNLHRDIGASVDDHGRRVHLWRIPPSGGEGGCLVGRARSGRKGPSPLVTAVCLPGV